MFPFEFSVFGVLLLFWTLARAEFSAVEGFQGGIQHVLFRRAGFLRLFSFQITRTAAGRLFARAKIQTNFRPLLGGKFLQGTLQLVIYKRENSP